MFRPAVDVDKPVFYRSSRVVHAYRDMEKRADRVMSNDMRTLTPLLARRQAPGSSAFG